MRYLVTGFNSETGETYRGEEIDQAGAEHQAVSWVERQPIGSHAQVVQRIEDCPWDDRIVFVSLAKRVMGGVEWLS